MTYRDNAAAYALNSYTWKLLEANLGWTKVPVEGKGDIVPIVPIAQQPELLATGKPFIVYGNARHPADHLYQLVNESISYTIYAAGKIAATDVSKICNLLAETFARQDEAARDVNEWLVEEERGRIEAGISPASRDVGFSSIKTIVSKGADPADEEGGYVAGLVMVEAKYVELSTAPEVQTNGFTYSV